MLPLYGICLKLNETRRIILLILISRQENHMNINLVVYQNLIK
jgi:hypothetical protein